MNELWIVRELEKIASVQPKKLEKFLEYLKKDRGLFKEVVISAYVDGVISISKAAELLEITRDKLIEEYKSKGIPIRKLSREDVIAEVEVVKWF